MNRSVQDRFENGMKTRNAFREVSQMSGIQPSDDEDEHLDGEEPPAQQVVEAKQLHFKISREDIEDVRPPGTAKSMALANNHAYSTAPPLQNAATTGRVSLIGTVTPRRPAAQ